MAEALNGETTHFTWDQALELPQLLATSDGTRYLHGLGLAAVEHAGQWYYPHTDALGSLRRWSDASGQVVGALTYDPYGAITHQQGVIPSPLGFAGEWHDRATELQYLRARWYQPATGRFTQVDPFPGVLPLPATQHPYQYALNNPLRYTDPSGESPLLLAVGIGAVIGGAVGGIGYALQHPGQSLGEYARNAEFRRAVGIGAASGAVAGLVGWAVPAGFAALGMKAATAGGAAFIGGITGALAAGAGRITANLLTPCMKWYTGVSSAMFWGALGGALLGWAGWHVKQWWVARTTPKVSYMTEGVVYRGGSREMMNLTPRPGVDTTGLSTFDHLESAVAPGKKAQIIDVSRLPNYLRAIPDAPPPRHVSITPVDTTLIESWAATRGTETLHPFTKAIQDAIIGEIRRPK